jgi:hypothetical protein
MWICKHVELFASWRGGQMALSDNMREFFRMRFRRIDGQLSKEAKSAAADLKQRVDMYVEQVDADVIAHIKGKIAEEEKLYGQLESAPAQAKLPAPARQEEPEAAPPAQAREPHAEAVNWLKDRAGAAPARQEAEAPATATPPQAAANDPPDKSPKSRVAAAAKRKKA